VVARVHTRDEVFAGPHKEMAPDLTLELADGGLISILASDVPFRSRAVASGTHRREGVFMARGPGLECGVRLPALSILDVAPLLLDSLDLEVPADMEGRVPAGAFHPAWRRARPARPQPAKAVEAPPNAVEAPPKAALEGALFTKEDELKLAQRLRDLGYIE
jgi:hypothetical protein